MSIKCVILVRNPRGPIVVIDDGSGENPYVAVFDDAAAAEKAASEIPICQAWDYQIVELEI